MNSQWILNIFFSSKFTSRNLILFLSHVCGETTAPHLFCRTSAVVLTFFFWPLHLRPFIYRKVRAISFAQLIFLPVKQKLLVVPVPLTICINAIVRLRCRCSCEIDRTSAAPLLLIHETSVKSS